jgi:putative peptidoglycan lipid II flippase
MALPLPPAIGLDPRWGVAGLTVSAGIAGWLEFILLRRTLNRRIGTTGLPLGFTARLWASAAAAAAAGWGVKLAIGHRNPVLAAALILTPYGLVYLGASLLAGVEEAAALLARVPGAAAALARVPGLRRAGKTAGSTPGSPRPGPGS